MLTDFGFARVLEKASDLSKTFCGRHVKKNNNKKLV
jgi:hypothetical protein